MIKVPIFSDEVSQQGGWHGRALKDAFLERGYEAVFVELHNCQLDLTGDKPKLVIPHFNTIPSIAFVRGIAAGTLQQVITRLNILHILRLQGVRVYNDAKAIERTVDKAMTSFLLKNNGVPTPATWVCESRSFAHDVIKQQLSKGNQLVIKPLFGSQGKGVKLLDAKTRLPLPKDVFVEGVFYLQQFINTGDDYHDYRVFVIQQNVVATMRRSGKSWLNNVAQGALCEPAENADILSIALQAAKILQIDYCGVDIIRDINGDLFVLEVNSIPAWQGLQATTNANIAQMLVDDLLS
jgi:RimK family alpha-L-glutamate ligase